MPKLQNFFAPVCCLALLSAAACSGSKDPAATANGVFPAQGFAGRQQRVEISGDNTSFSASTAVSFGADITVASVTVASPTALFADITISSTAAAGVRDVTVATGNQQVVLTGAFEVTLPTTTVVQGQVAQGSIANMTIKNNDLENLFDDTSTGDGVFTPIVYTNLTVTTPPGSTLQISNVTPFEIDGVLLIDVDATPGDITIASGPAGGTIVRSPGGTLAVAARTAKVLTGGTATGNIAIPGDSALYSITPAAAFPALSTVAITSDVGAPDVAILPASGHFADLIGADVSVDTVTLSGSFYAIPFDLSGQSAYSYTLTSVDEALAVLTESEPANNSSATAQVAATLPVVLENATLSSDADVDWVQFTVPAGKVIHAFTLAGDPETDTVVTIYGPNDATIQFAQSDDSGYQDDVSSDPTVTAGTYWVAFSASPDGLIPGQTHYNGIIELE